MKVKEAIATLQKFDPETVIDGWKVTPKGIMPFFSETKVQWFWSSAFGACMGIWGFMGMILLLTKLFPELK